MIDKNRLAALFSSIAIFLSSDIAMAVEKTSSGSKMSYWPIIILFALLVIFRKKLFNEATPQTFEPGHHDAPDQAAVEKVEVEVETKVEAKPKAETKVKAMPETKPAAKAKPKTKPKAKTGIVNIRDGSNQCQASTAKGTRCKRTTTLEEASATIDGTTYELTVCSQHNNDSIKPFAELIK